MRHAICSSHPLRHASMHASTGMCMQVGKEKTRFPTRKAVETIAKQLRGQMVSGSAAAVLTDF